MNKKARVALLFFIIFTLIFAVWIMYFVFADTAVVTPTTINVNEDDYNIYNITVTNGGATEDVNITQVNITLPTGFNFVADSNGTDAFGTFSNTSNVLSWENSTWLIMNSTSQHFWFNASASNPGTFNITVLSLFATGIINITNITVIVNDTTAPSITFGSLTPSTNSINTESEIAGNITTADNGIFSSLIVKLYNSTGGLVNSSINETASSNIVHFFNFTGLSPGTYYLNATVNDTYNNVNSTETRTIYLVNSTFEFNGTVKDENDNLLNSSVINITIINQNNWQIISYSSTNSNASGWFNLSVPSYSLWMYRLDIIKRNETTNTVEFKSKSIPAFPSIMLQQLSGTTFYLQEAGTINLTAINASGDRAAFQYQIKDTKLGYPVAEQFGTYTTEAIVYVPKNRNYSIMVYPNVSMPVSFDWNNFSSNISYNFSDGISSYNATTSTLHKQFNLTMSMPRVSGYISYSGISGWDEFTVIPFLLEPGNMIHAQYGAMPYNMSGFSGESDFYNLSIGFYNISLPATVESSTIILFATARNGSLYVGGFRNISLDYSTYSSSNELVNFNFTQMFGLLGTADNITLESPNGSPGGVNITTAKQLFRLVNETNSTLSNAMAHIEVTVDYSNYGAIEFSWMVDVEQSSSATFSLPLLNVTGIKEMNIFVAGGGEGPQNAPRRISSLSVSQINTNSNITIRNFNPGDINGTLSASDITISMYISNSTCDVPNPPSSCLIGSPGNAGDDSLMMRAVMGGGRISFRMGYGNISVHYVNTDMLASGPPDALFENDAGTSESSNSFENAIKFGSYGPTIYDYILVSIPYIEGSSSQTGLNESADVNISVTSFYDDNWNPIWASSNGTNASALAGNYSHYSTHQNEWQILMNGVNCSKTNPQLNATNPCYINTTSNKIWIRIPHFSGTAPTVIGSLITSVSSSDGGETPSSSGGDGTTTSFWTSTYVYDDKNLDEKEPLTREFSVKHRAKIKINNEIHYVGVVNLTETTATINVTSEPQQAVLSIGEEKKFELTNDTYYDISVKLNSISDNKANLTIIGIHEEIPEEEKAPVTGEEIKEGEEEKKEEKEVIIEKGKNLVWIVTIVVIALLIIIAVAFLIYKKKKHH